MNTPESTEDFAARSARRRQARRVRRRRANARVDVAIGGLLAIVVLLAAPGLAIVALLAAIALGACLVSLALGHRRTTRALKGARRS